MKYSWLEEYCLQKTGSLKDYKEEWEATRFLLKGKMFALLGCNKNGEEIITLKLHPENGQLLREQFEDITPGYYMNKTHWNSVDLNGDVPDEVLKEMLDESYSLIRSGLPAKIRSELDQQPFQ
jgi:predicted DNA-binding protein (MmcQ/YjbR family)